MFKNISCGLLMVNSLLVYYCLVLIKKNKEVLKNIFILLLFKRKIFMILK